MNTLERLLQEAQTLSAAEQIKLASLLIAQAQMSEPSLTDEERREAFRQIRGKYKNKLSSTEEFIARKDQERKKEQHLAIVAEVCGKYAATAPTTEQFLAWKREEIELEEKRH